MENSEINKLVALSVMGWTVHPRNTAHYMVDGGIACWVSEWMPTRDIECAWRVVERMQELGYFPTIWLQQVADKKAWRCEFAHLQERDAVSEHESAPMAICLAALQALGVEVKV